MGFVLLVFLPPHWTKGPESITVPFYSSGSILFFFSMGQGSLEVSFLFLIRSYPVALHADLTSNLLVRDRKCRLSVKSTSLVYIHPWVWFPSCSIIMSPHNNNNKLVEKLPCLLPTSHQMTLLLYWRQHIINLFEPPRWS